MHSHLISSILAWVPGLGTLGIGLRSAKIIGLILLAVGAYLWIRQSGYTAAVEKYKVERAKAIEKNAKENQQLKDAAHKDELEHQTTITKSQEKLKRSTDEIKSLKPSQCLDVRLDAIGLR